MSAGAPLSGVALRWARAVLLAATAWGPAGAGHVLAGGDPPSPVLVTALIALTAWPLTLALNGRASRARVVALLAGSQFAMHAVLVAASWSAPARGVVRPPAGPHEMPGMDPMTTMTPVAPLPGGAGHAMEMFPGPGMLLAHLAAALLLGLVLADGERALFSLLGLLAQLARPALRFGSSVARVLARLVTGSGFAPGRVTAAVPVADPGRPRLERLLATSVARRGPPLAA